MTIVMRRDSYFWALRQKGREKLHSTEICVYIKGFLQNAKWVNCCTYPAWLISHLSFCTSLSCLIKTGSLQFSFLPGIGGNSQMGVKNADRSLCCISPSTVHRQIPGIKVYFKQLQHFVF